MSDPASTYAQIDWETGDTPRSIQFDDPYFARENGRAETQHVFIAANDLPDRWHDAERFTIAELGFGTGLNFLETLQLWKREPRNGQSLRFVSFERYPMATEDIARALAPWPELHQHRDALLQHWPPAQGSGVHTVPFGNAELQLHLGDANATLRDWAGSADAWYLDGFSPAKNPDLWSAELMQMVHDHTVPGGTFATYTAAGFVRRNLLAAGFIVEKIPGYGRKRESLAGHRPE